MLAVFPGFAQLKKMGKYSAQDVAAWFVRQPQAEKLHGGELDGDVITNMKLQKLLYYAQGCYLALKDEPLFDECLVAWQHGPAVREVYETYKDSGSGPIEGAVEGDADVFDEYTEDVLCQVWNAFGCYTASKLRKMAQEELPWQEAIAKHKGTPLSLLAMEQYFRETYVAE